MKRLLVAAIALALLAAAPATMQTTFTALNVCAGACATPDTASGANSGDVYVEGELEVDGATDLDGTTTVGTGSNTVTISTTGIALAGTARATHEVFVPAGDFLANAGTPARALIGSANAQGWAADAASDESISALFKVPDGFAAADATCSIGWSTTGTTDTQAVFFDLITVPVADGEDSGVAGNTDSDSAALGATAAADELHELAITVGASTEWAANDIVYVTINRDADNAGDTLAADASIHYLRCTLTVTDLQ